MKKSVLIGIAIVAVGTVLWIGFRGNGDSTTTEYAEHTEKEISVSSSGAGGLDESIKSVQSVDGLVYAEDKLSDAVKALLGLDGEEHNYNSLGKAIRGLSKELSTDDVAALRELLTKPNDRFPEGMRPIEINAVKNDVLDRLLRQNTLPEGIGLQLVEMASNPENDPVWRDYCIQFSPMAWERIDAEYRMSNTEHGISKKAENHSVQNYSVELKAIQDSMFAALDERDSTIAGTSLIGLELLSRTHDEFDREAIVSKASEIAADESASAASRMTALRLTAGISNDEQGISNVEVADVARSLAQTGETVLLRSAAIVTLGEVGTEADRELLESFTSDSNQQIVSAAKLALQKMDAPKKPVVDRTVPATVSEATVPVSTQKLPPVLIN